MADPALKLARTYALLVGEAQDDGTEVALRLFPLCRALIACREALAELVPLDDGDNSTLWPHAAKFKRGAAALAQADEVIGERT